MSTPISEVTELALATPNTPITNSLGTTIAATKNLVIWKKTWAAKDVNDDSDLGVNGSYYPASIDLNAATTTMSVTLSANDKYKDVAFQLIGELRAHVIVNGSPCYVGKTNSVPLSAKHPGIPWGYDGDIQWKLIDTKANNTVYVLNQTRVEIYGLSSSLPSFLKNPAVPVRFLRYIALPEPKTDYKHWVATTCMTDFWFRYDVYRGKARYAGSNTGGSYKFKFWVKDMFSRHLINCYDQAGIVQLANCLKEGNPTNTWAYTKTYGYINKTQLVGVGQSNNPFYRSQLAIRCIDHYDPRRTMFGNHSYIILDGKVMDACCGPHTGTEDLSTYLTNAIDQSPATNTSRTTTMCQGITSLSTSTSVSSATVRFAAGALPDPTIETVDRAMVKGSVASAAPSEAGFSNADWDALGPLLADRFRLRHTQRTIDIGHSGSETDYLFRYDDALCALRVSIFVDHQTAIEALRQHLGTYQRSLDEVFSPPPPGTEKGQVNLEAENLSVWIRGDTLLILDIDIDSPDLDIKRVAESIDKFVEQSSQNTPEQTLTPRLSYLPELDGPVALGSEFAITPSVWNPLPSSSCMSLSLRVNKS